MHKKLNRKVVSAQVSPRHSQRSAQISPRHSQRGPDIVRNEVKKSPVKQQFDIFDGTFDEELSKIPKHLHAKVAFLVQQNVEKRVDEYINEFRKELDLSLRHQYHEDQLLIQKLQQEKQLGVVHNVDSDKKVKPLQVRTPRNEQAVVSPRAKNVPKVIVELSKEKDNPIGGLPFKAWEQAQESQYQRHIVSKSPRMHKIDLQETMQSKVNEWQKGLRSGESSLRASMTSRKNDESSRHGQNDLHSGMGSLPVSPKSKHKPTNALAGEVVHTTGTTNERVVPQTQLFLTSDSKIKIASNYDSKKKQNGSKQSTPRVNGRFQK